MARPYTVNLPGGGQIVVNANSANDALQNAGGNGTVAAGSYKSSGAPEYPTTEMQAYQTANPPKPATAPVATPPQTSNNPYMPPTTSNAPLTQGMDPAEFEKARQGILYSLSNPEFALQNTLADKGVPLYNPVVRRGILPLAQSLGSAFTIQGAGNSGYGAQTNVADEFRNFISNTLNGAGGGIRGAMGTAQQTLQGLGGTLRDAVNMQRTGANPSNPFVGALLSTLYDPQALIGLTGALSLPNLGPELTQSMGELQGLNAARAWRQVGQGQGEDFFKYLLGQ